MHSVNLTLSVSGADIYSCETALRGAGWRLDGLPTDDAGAKQCVGDDVKAYLLGRGTVRRSGLNVKVILYNGDGSDPAYNVERNMGYVQKDHGKPHYVLARSPNISAEELEHFRNEYNAVAVHNADGTVLVKRGTMLTSIIYFAQSR